MRKRILLAACAVSLSSGCASLFGPSPQEIPSELTVRKHTVIPAQFLETQEARLQELAKEASHLYFPTDLITIRRIQRQRAELREGPSANFFVKDRILEKGEAVVVLERAHRWAKVLSTDKQLSGWAHEQTLSRSSPQSAKPVIRLQVSSLPRIFAIKEIRKIFRYGTKDKVAVKIPQGYAFRRLSSEGPFVLVLFPETRSLAWVLRKDVI